MELNIRQYQFLDKLKENAEDKDRRWISVEHEDPELIRPLLTDRLIFIKDGQARITARGILLLEEDAGWIKPQVKTYHPTTGLDIHETLRIQNEILDHFEKKYPEIKHVRAVKLIQARRAQQPK